MDAASSRAALIVSVMEISTPLGPMYGGASEEGVCFIEFIDRIKLEPELTRLCRELQAVIAPGKNRHLLLLEKELQEYFEKERTAFTVPLHLTGTEFQRSVWETLLKIPFGKTWTYKQQAIALNKLDALRAVASANGQNKHAIVIPCHRVIGSNGSLTGYAGGLPKKEWLLKHEMDKTGHTLELPFE